MLEELQEKTKSLYNPEKVMVFKRFFKTGVGEYGEGDQFYGISVPLSRRIAKEFQSLPINDIDKLLRSKVHEERLIALLILVLQYQIGSVIQKKQIVDFYLSHTKYINNWDLVDLSAHKIVGDYYGTYLSEKVRVRQLLSIAKSQLLWDQRIAMIATFACILQGRTKETFSVAAYFIEHTNTASLKMHDLMQKAIGWMLREAGKRVSEEKESEFLKKYYKIMPRTALRYAIERFDPQVRERYLRGKV